MSNDDLLHICWINTFVCHYIFYTCFFFSFFFPFFNDFTLFSWDKVHYIRSSTNCIHCLIYFHKLFSSTTKVEVTRSTNDGEKKQKKNGDRLLIYL